MHCGFISVKNNKYNIMKKFVQKEHKKMSCCNKCECKSECKYTDIAYDCNVCKINTFENEDEYYNEDGKWDNLRFAR